MSEDLKTMLGVTSIVVLFALFSFALFQGAWLCDDAYITYRSVENFVSGNGLGWNIAERVQAYTHPLWMFCHAAAFYFTHEIFFTAMAVAFVVTLLALGVALLGVARFWTWAVIGGLALLFSRAFMSYSSSGLENPMSHLLLALFMLLYCVDHWTPRRLFLIALTSALLVLNRMDALLFVAPALAYCWWRQRSWKATLVLIAGFLPFAGWELFSVVYYGFPFPNTAYAKLGTGIETLETLQQGINYFRFTWARDPITLPVIGLALIAPLLCRAWRLIPVSLGIALYLLYIVKIGGDFMGGRFFAAPMFMAVLLLMRMPQPGWPLLYAPLLVVIPWAAMTAPWAPLTVNASYGKDMTGWRDESGIGDEHRFYFTRSSLQAWRAMRTLPEAQRRPMPNHSYADRGRQYRRENRFQAPIHGSVGYRGFFGGPSVHIVDYYALADPLLARLPASYAPKWRIGHFTRHVPAGYTEALEELHQAEVAAARQGEAPDYAALQDNPQALPFKDKRLAEYYAHLVNITRGPLWSPSRWKDILWMNLGRYDDLIDVDYYRFYGIRKLALDELNKALKGNREFHVPSAGVHVGLPAPSTAPQLRIALGQRDTWQILFMHEDTVLGKVKVEKSPAQGAAGLTSHTLDAPAKALAQGYDAVRIIPFKGTKQYVIGALSLDAAP